MKNEINKQAEIINLESNLYALQRYLKYIDERKLRSHFQNKSQANDSICMRCNRRLIPLDNSRSYPSRAWSE